MTAPDIPDGRRRAAASDGAWRVVPVPGDLDFYSAPDFGRELDALAADGVRRIVLDMTDAGFLDSSGLRILLRTARELRDSGGELRLAAPQDQTLRLIDLTQVGPLLPTFADVGAAADG